MKKTLMIGVAMLYLFNAGWGAVLLNHRVYCWLTWGDRLESADIDDAITSFLLLGLGPIIVIVCITVVCLYFRSIWNSWRVCK